MESSPSNPKQVNTNLGFFFLGGIRTTLSIDGKVGCENNAKYGTKAEYVQTSATGHHSQGATTHISDIPVCYGNGISHPTMKKGQVWRFQAYYDFDQFKGMKRGDGTWDEVMGLSVNLVRVKS